MGLKMVLMVIFLSCAGVSVHLKNPDFSYFVAYIAHSRLSVIGYIYRVKREKSARISARIRYRQNTSMRIVWFGVSFDVLSLVRVSLPPLAACRCPCRFPWAGGGAGGCVGPGGEGGVLLGWRCV